MVGGDAAVQVNQGRPTEGGAGADGVSFGGGGSRRGGRQGDIVELEVLGFEGRIGPGTVGTGDGVQRHIDAVGQHIAAGDAASAPEPVVATAGVIGGVGGDVPDIVGAAGFDAEEVAAVLRDVHVETALLYVVPVKVGEGKDDVIEVGRAVCLLVFDDGENARLRIAAADLVDEIAVGGAQRGTEAARLVDGSIDR